MARYFIWAAEQMYQGLHGIETHRVVECSSYEEACDWAQEMSIEVIESYCEDEYRDMLNEDDFDSYEDEELAEEAFDEDLCDLKSENTCWIVTEVDEEKASGISTQELDRMFYMDDEETLKKYGKPDEI